MEEEKKEEIEILGQTGIMKPVTENSIPEAPAEPVVEQTQEAAPTVTMVQPVTEVQVEDPVQPAEEAPAAAPVEAAPAIETPVVETPVVEAPAAPVEQPAVEQPAPAPDAQPVQETAPAPTAEQPAPEAPKKKGKGGLILIILALLALGGFAVWYFVLGGDKVLSGKQEEPQQEEKEEEKKEEKKEEPKVTTLTEKDIEEYSPMITTILAYTEGKTTLKATDLNNQQILDIGYMGIAGSGTISKEELKKSIEKRLGNVKYTDESILCAIDNKPLIIYDAENGTYTYDGASHGHGGVGSPYRYDYFQSAEKDETNGIVTINYKFLYGNNPGDVGAPEAHFYKTAKDSTAKQNSIYDEDDAEPDKVREIADKVYEDKKNELPTVTFKFVKNANGDYSFSELTTK
jgi:hypothetical protein